MSCNSCQDEILMRSVSSDIAQSIMKSLTSFYNSLLEFVQEQYIHIMEDHLKVDSLVLLNYCHALKLIIITGLLLPAVIVLFLTLSSVFITFYKWRHQLQDVYTHDLWAAARRSLALCWDVCSSLWHGYDVEGLDKIPNDRGALLIYYHGAIPLDIYYLIARVYLRTGRLIHPIGDHFLFYIPGFQNLLRVFHVHPGSAESCVQLLKENKLVAISPGGVREALFSYDYKIIWNKRKGFARVALQSKALIFPLFTKNSRQAINTVYHFEKPFNWLYEKTKLPLSIFYGYFPVKMRTYIGEAIQTDNRELTPEKLADETREALCKLIAEHQQSRYILSAIFERFHRNPSNLSLS